jgi:hypothetical protein
LDIKGNKNMAFDFIENFMVQVPKLSGTDFNFSENFNTKRGLIIEVAAIHEGLTANYNNYSAIELEKALQSWVEPYPKPIILNHDVNSEPIGRVMAARLDKEDDGSNYVRLQIAITDPVAAQKIADKRYLTGSVGGRAGKAICSISGEDLAAEDASGRPKLPRFKRGQIYKGKLAYIDMQNISFKEYSFVNQPADQRSGVRDAKAPGEKSTLADSENWIAKSRAFILNMDEEDIISIEENESILKNLKKKESKPMYLHLKGAFLTALAIQEMQNGNNQDKSLLSTEDSTIIKSEENTSMEQEEVKEDILAVAEELSQDLSTIAASGTHDASGAKQDETVTAQKDETTAELAETPAEQTVEGSDKQQISNDDSEKAEEQEVDSEKAEESKESPSEVEGDGPKEAETKTNDLKVADNAGLEQGDVKLEDIVKSLEEENARLRAALHKTLVERVVDTKIGLGLESAEEREKLISDHITRTASSLADSLRDMAKLPEKKTRAVEVPAIKSELQVTAEEKVVTMDAEIQVEENKEPALEQIFVDALMGRRKL